MVAASIDGRSTILNAEPIRRAHPRFVDNLDSLGADVEWVSDPEPLEAGCPARYNGEPCPPRHLEVRAGLRAAAVALRRPARPRRRRAHPLPGRDRRRRPGRPDAGLRPGAARRARACVLDEDDTVGVRGASSRGICYAQKSLEIFERLGIYERIARQGHHLVGRPHLLGRRRGLHASTCRTTASREQPPFINLQQFYLEWFLVDRILELGRDRPALEEPGDARRARRRRASVVEVETPAGALRARGRLARSTPPAPTARSATAARPRGAPVAQHRPLVHHRRALQEAAADRALDLGRRALQRGPRASGST